MRECTVDKHFMLLSQTVNVYVIKISKLNIIMLQIIYLKASGRYDINYLINIKYVTMFQFHVLLTNALIFSIFILLLSNVF